MFLLTTNCQFFNRFILLETSSNFLHSSTGENRTIELHLDHQNPLLLFILVVVPSSRCVVTILLTAIHLNMASPSLMRRTNHILDRFIILVCQFMLCVVSRNLGVSECPCPTQVIGLNSIVTYGRIPI